MKFLAIGTHPPVSPEEEAATDPSQVKANVDYCRAQMASNVYDAVYVMQGVGRLVIGNADSEVAFRVILETPPDHPQREWKINQLLDYEAVISAYLQGLGLEGV